MGFHTFSGGYIGNRPPAKTEACDCAGSTPANDSGDLVKAMQALVLNAKIDKALAGHTPHTHSGGAAMPLRGVIGPADGLHTQAKDGAALTPRGLLGVKRHSAPEKAAQRAHRTRWGEIADAQGKASKPSTSAPLKPRGLTAGGQ